MVAWCRLEGFALMTGFIDLIKRLTNALIMSFLSSSSDTFSIVRSSLDLDSCNPAFEELCRHITQRHPLNTFMLVDVFDNAESRLASICLRGHKYIPFMHLDNMRLSTDLWMNRHGKDEGIIFFICIVKLLEPQFLKLMCTDKSVLCCLSVSRISVKHRQGRNHSLYQLFPA